MQFPYILRYILSYAAVIGVISFGVIDHTLRDIQPGAVLPATLTFALGAAVLGALMYWLLHNRSLETKVIGNAVALIGTGTLVYRANWPEAITSAVCWGVGLWLLFALAGSTLKKTAK